MTLTQTYTSTLVIVECPECHMDFGITPAFERERRNKHDTFYCPAGHHQHFPGKSEAERLRDQLQWAQESRDAARELAQRESRRRAAAQGQVTKIRKRIGRGVCPCCNRTFADLGRHMAGQHPEYAEATS